jgi:hypothetical protein
MSSTSTLPTPPDDRPLPADRVLHAVLLLVLAAVLALGVTGRLGVSSEVASAQVDDVPLSVRHAAATRPGISTPLDITVSSETVLPDRVIEIEADYMVSFDSTRPARHRPRSSTTANGNAGPSTCPTAPLPWASRSTGGSTRRCRAH